MRVMVTGQADEQYLENNLALFACLLRREGLPVGTTEVVDALNALAAGGFCPRHRFKTALQATLVKSKKHEEVFDCLFDRFFVHYHEHQRRIDEMQAEQKLRQERLSEAAKSLSFKGEELNLDENELQQFSNLSVENRSRLLSFVERTEKGNKVELSFKPVLEGIVKSHLRYWRAKDEQKPEAASSVTGGGGAGSDTCAPGDQLIKEMDIERVVSSRLPQAEELILRLARRLSVKILRRKHSGSFGSQLDLRRSIRHNLQYGGPIFTLKFKPKRRFKQQILMLCDVSASMKSYSTFVIHFLYNLHEVVRNLSCFTFSDHLEDLTGDLKGKNSLPYLLSRVIRHSKTWGGGTNLGAALRSLQKKEMHRLNHKTTVIIVSDTKTIDLDGAIKALAALKEKVKRVIWLNPLQQNCWPDYRSVSVMAALTEMWPCSTIAQLEEALAQKI